jgi:hypothetical protein
MRRYTEQELERYERLVAEARDRVGQQQVVIENLTNLDGLEAACSVLESMMETLVLYEQERVRILDALSR